MSVFGFTIIKKQPKVATSTKSKVSAKPKKEKSDTSVAIALAMAAVGSILDDSVVVPFANRPLAELKVRAEGIRPNGSFGAWYPAAHEVSRDQAIEATQWLVAKGQRAKGHPKPKASVVESQPALETELAALKAQMQLLLSGKPLPAEGHTIGEPEPAPVEIAAEVAIGNIVAIGDDLYEVAEAKNGKPFLRLFA